jgi:hypothetical protein
MELGASGGDLIVSAYVDQPLCLYRHVQSILEATHCFGMEGPVWMHTEKLGKGSAAVKPTADSTQLFKTFLIDISAYICFPPERWHSYWNERAHN